MEFAMEAPHSYGVFQEDVPVSSTVIPSLFFLSIFRLIHCIVSSPVLMHLVSSSVSRKRTWNAFFFIFFSFQSHCTVQFPVRRVDLS